MTNWKLEADNVRREKCGCCDRQIKVARGCIRDDHGQVIADYSATLDHPGQSANMNVNFEIQTSQGQDIRIDTDLTLSNHFGKMVIGFDEDLGKLAWPVRQVAEFVLTHDALIVEFVLGEDVTDMATRT